MYEVGTIFLYNTIKILIINVGSVEFKWKSILVNPYPQMQDNRSMIREKITHNIRIYITQVLHQSFM